jgi:hypothetical protein
MLSSLSSVEGYYEYLQWLSSRACTDIAWRAEAKALFEMNKPRHPLSQICSQQKGEPEGIFRMPDGKSLGLVECALVKYLFEAHHKKKACENTCKNLFGKAKQYLRSADNVLVLLVNSFKAPPSYDDATQIFSTLQTKGITNRFYKARFGLYGYFERAPIAKELACEMSEDSLVFMVEKSGFISGASNSNIGCKISRILSEKRKQHKAKHSGVYKVFYFLIDCPPSVLLRLRINELHIELKPDEHMVCCATGVSGGINIESKLVFASGPTSLDFSNPFFTGETFFIR